MARAPELANMSPDVTAGTVERSALSILDSPLQQACDACFLSMVIGRVAPL